MKAPEKISIGQWKQQAVNKLLLTGSRTAILDAELILAHLLEKDRAYLHAHDDEIIATDKLKIIDSWLELRENHVPIAYITGKKEFYGRDFMVTPDVLIPRPETEDLIDLIKQYISPNMRLLDVGTGSGAIGITLKKELPEVNMTVSDISKEALEIARKNASSLDAKPIRYIESNLLYHWLDHAQPKPFDVIVANLPYVDRTWKTSPELKYEPAQALYAEQDGLELIFKMINQSKKVLRNGGLLILEADPEQHPSIIAYAKNNGLSHEKTIGYAIALRLA